MALRDAEGIVLRRILIATASVLLGACGTAPQRASTASLPPASPAQRPADVIQPSPAPPVATKAPRPGGFYKDDGPGDSPPPGLANVPDARPQVEPLHRFANEPYNALGQDYTPSKELAPFRQKGLASWYGRMFHGKKTSSGEPYDMYAMTAAHPTLPIPSYARVTNVASGESVVVRINDRGPFHPGRVIDLSYAAATRLGYVSRGHTLVEVESIIPDQATLVATQSPPPARKAPQKPLSPATAGAPEDALPIAQAATTADPIAALAQAGDETQGAAPRSKDVQSNGIFVQLGAFRTSDGAEIFRDKVRREIGWLTERLLIDVSSGMYRLHLGPYASLVDARAMAARVGDALRLKPLVIQR